MAMPMPRNSSRLGHAEPVGQPRAEHAGDQQGRTPEQELVGRKLDVHGPRLRLRPGQPP